MNETVPGPHSDANPALITLLRRAVSFDQEATLGLSMVTDVSDELGGLVMLLESCEGAERVDREALLAVMTKISRRLDMSIHVLRREHERRRGKRRPCYAPPVTEKTS